MDTPAPSAGPPSPDEHTAPPEHTEGTLLSNTPEPQASLGAPLHETPKHGLLLDEPTAVGPIEPSDAEIKAEAAVAYASPHRWIRFGVIGIALVACVGLAMFASQQPAAPDPLNSIDHLYGHVTVPYDQLPSPKLDAASNLPNIATVNGQLDIQGSLVLAPSAQPAAPIPGQLYFDQTSSELSYFNGKSFNTVLTTDTLPPQQTGLSAGGGLSLANGLLTNAGVLTLQGKSGNVSLSAGPGLQVAGTTFSNTGVLSIGGLSGAIVLGNGLSASNGTLASTSVQTLSTDGSLNISDDGNGNYTITGPMGVGNGNVSTVGGTAGHLAVFNNAQAISDSIISQTGTTISVGGNLVVTGTISATSYSGDGASITNVNATQLNGQSSSYYTNASNISSGTVSDARLSINVPLLNTSNNFTGSLQHNGNAICDTSGNCVGVSGGGIGGSGTTNKLALFTGTGFTVGNSLLSQDAGATTVTVGGNVSVTGSLSAASLTGNGSGVSNVNAAQLGGQAASYYTNASNISTGTLNDARLSTNVALKNAATNFTNSLQHNGNNICDASGNCVGVSGGSIGGNGTANLIALFTGSGFTVGNSILSQDVGATTVTVAGNLVATSFSGSGANLTSLNGSNVSSGTLSDARLSGNVALKNTSSNFTSSLQHNGNDVCDTSGNCVGTGSGGALGGGGTANKIAMFTGSGYTVSNSLLSQDAGATTVTASGNLVATGSATANSLVSGNLDTASATSLGLGTGTASTVSIGKSGGSTTVNSSFAVQGGGAEVIQSILASPSTTLGLTNTSFETNTSGWNARTGCTLTQDTTTSMYGSASAKCTNTATAGAGFNYPISLTAGQQYTLSFTLKGTNGASALNFGYAYNGSNETTYVQTGLYINGNWGQVFSYTFTPASVSGSPYLFIKQTDATARNIWLDGVQLEQGGTASLYTPGTVSFGKINHEVEIQLQEDGPAMRITNSGNTYGSVFSVDTNAQTVGIGINGVTATNTLQVNNLTTTDYNSAVAISSGTSAHKGLVLQGVSSQTANLLEFQNSSGSVLASFAADGALVTGDISVGGYANAALSVISWANNTTSEAIQARAGQTADLLQFQNSSGSVLAKIDASGNLQAPTINATSGYQLNGTPGSSVTCSGGQVLQNQVVSGGITTGGSCAAAGVSGATTIGALDGGTANANGATISGTTLYLQSASASFAGLVTTGMQTFAGDKTFTGNLHISNVLLADASDITFTAADTTTDPNVIFNMQCRTGCSSTQGRFAIQSNGSDAFWIGYDTTSSKTYINVPGGVDIMMGSGTTNGVEGALTHNFTCTSAEVVHNIVKISGTAVANDNGGGTTGSIAVAGVVVAKPSSTVCTVAFSGVVQVWGSTNTINVNLPVITSNIAGAATTTNTPSNGATLGHAFTGKDGSNLFWVLLNGG